MSENTVVISAAELEAFIRELFITADMCDADADFHAKSLVQTNLWGVDSHGIMRVPVYFRRLQCKAINPKPDVKIRTGSLGLEVVDGDDGAGFVVGREAMQRAMDLAEQYNVGMVGAIRSNHFGAAAIYARMAAERGMIGIAMTNVMPLIVATGASRPVVGNNPFAVAIPTYGDFPFVLDISCSKVAGGKITLAIKKNEKIPTDWATDSEGRPTDDPTEAFKGFLLPMGEHKGLGLAYMVDILAGVITGGVFSHQMKSMYANQDEPSLTGHFMIAIKIDAIIDPLEMKERMGQYYRRLKDTPMWDESKCLYLPGEIEYLTALERAKSGIPLPLKTYEELIELAEEMNIKSKLTLI